MKKLFINSFISIVFLLTGQGVISDGVKAQEPDSTFFVFLGIGQSNMQGKAPIESKDKNSTSDFTDAD